MRTLFSDKQLDLYIDEDNREASEDENEIEKNIIETIHQTVTWSTDWTAETIFNLISRSAIDLSPAFQRRDAWNEIKKNRFIESLYLGLPIPQLVLAEDNKNKGKFIVVDGKQRLTTLFQYFNNELIIKNTIINDINGKTFDQAKATVPSFSDFIQSQTIRSVILKNWHSENLLYSIFYRLNSGSLQLSPQELRSALKPGPFMGSLAKYAEDSKAIKFIFGDRHPDPRMKDVEVLLRYISFKLFLKNYTGEYKEFLDVTCDYFNIDWDVRKLELESILSQFENSITCVYNIFGEHSFKRFNISKWENRFSKAVFDIEIYIIENLPSGIDLNEYKDKILDAYLILCRENQNFLRSISTNTNNMQNTTTRFVLFAKQVEKLTGLAMNIPKNIVDVYESRYE